jgi:hypothetical protein
MNPASTTKDGEHFADRRGQAPIVGGAILSNLRRQRLRRHPEIARDSEAGASA